MKKLLLILSISIIFSCATAPVTELEDVLVEEIVEEEVVVVPVVEEVIIAASDEARERAIAAMEKAKSVKANIAVKDDYNTALAIFDEADMLADEADTTLADEAAYAKFIEAEASFLAAYDKTLEKRAEAQRELEKAKEDIKSVEDDAAVADEETGGDA